MTTATATTTLNVECEGCGHVLRVPAAWVLEGRAATCADVDRKCSLLSSAQNDLWAVAEPRWTWVNDPGVMIRRPLTRVCRLCGEEFVPVGNETYCRPSHRKLAAQFRSRHVEIRRCAWCRTEFVWLKRGRTVGRYCQRVCLYRALAEHRGPWVKRVARYPRHTACALCGVRLTQRRMRYAARYCGRRCAAGTQRHYSASHFAEGAPVSIREALRRLREAEIYTSQQTVVHWLTIRVVRGEHGHGRRSVSSAALDDLIADILSNPHSPRNRTGAAA